MKSHKLGYMRYLLLSLIILGGCQRTTKVRFDGREYYIDNKAIELNNKAVRAISENFDSLDYALKLLGESIHVDSNYYVAYQNKVNYEKDLERYDFGIGTIRAFIRRFPDNPSSYLMLGLRQEKKGNLDEAKISYRKALDLTMESYKRRNKKIDSVKDGLFVLTFLNGDTSRANTQFEKFKKDYDTLGNYKYETLREFIENIK